MLEKLWEIIVAHDDTNHLCLSFWSNALTGEAGEFGNLIKKLERGREQDVWDEDESLEEHADVFIYWVLMAKKLGWDLLDVYSAILKKIQKVNSCHK